MFVYLIVCDETLKLYVGQHKGSNLQKYLKQKISHALRGESERSHLYRAMRAYPKDSWSIHPLVSGIESRSKLDATEQHFIRALNARHPDIGYNICRGGEGFTGPHTVETKQKMLEKVRAYWERPESHERVSNEMKERWKNPEFRKKMVEVTAGNKYNLGRVQSEEEKRKRSESNRGKQNTLGHRLTAEHRRKISEGLKKFHQ